MTMLTKSSLIRNPEILNLYHSLIGFDLFFDDLDSFHKKTNYPPFNVIRVDELHYVMELAVAGFSPKDISVTSKQGVLTISAKTTESDSLKETNYIYKGLASRAFTKDFKLYEHIFVTGATFDNGILKVNLEVKLPDQLKEQKFTVMDHNQPKV